MRNDYFDEDDIHIGNVEILGESLRGPQDAGYGYYMGAEPARRPPARSAAALTRLRGALQQGIQSRAQMYVPAQRVLKSPYKDSTQFGVDCQGTFTPAAWVSGANYPTVNGLTRVYQSFKPAKAIVDEDLIVTFTNDSLGATTVAVTVSDGGDLILIQAFAGAYNCFPTAPNQSTGLSGRALASNSLGNGISWPTINGGIDLNITFAIKQTAIYRATPPSGYTTADISSIQVLARLNFMGPSLR